MSFWNFKENDEEIELRITGDIVSDDSAWIYQWFDIPATSPNKFRNELEKYSGKDLTVWIDSNGGDVFAGAGIYDCLKSHKGHVTVKVTGRAISAASVIAMAGDEIQMSPAAIMMIHNPWTSAQGDMDDFRAVANVLDTIKKSIMNAYELKTKKSKDEISNLMTAETWMDAEAAVKLGFADSILYQDDEPKVMAVNFGRMTVMNSLQESMKDGWKMIKALRDAENNKIENKKRILALEIDLI